MITQKWNKQRVVEVIQERHRQGLPLTNIRQLDTALASAAAREFGNCRNALIAAGLKPQPKRIWSKELIIQRIQRLHAEGLPLTKVYSHNRRLYASAKGLFGNWSNALRAAGFPEACVRRRKWSKQRVIEAIREQHRRKLPMTSVAERDGGLYAAVLRYFGGWHIAVSAAGLKPKIRRSWSKQIVIRELQVRHQKGLPMVNVSRHDGPLAIAAHLYFGSWNNALVAAGLQTRERKWSRQRVIDEVRAWKAKGLSMNMIWSDYRNLAAAARRYIGSWHEVMKAAGFESTPRKKWSPQRVIKEVQAWYRQGILRKDMGVEYQGLPSAVQKYFGNLKTALEAAGLEPKRHGKWSKQRVVQEIQNRHVRGLSIRAAMKQKKQLREAATRHFGNWANALEAAGLLCPEDKPKRRHKWSEERVIAAIRERHENGMPLANVHKDNAALARAANRYFGGWRNAVMAAGFQPAQRRWDKKLIVDEILYRHQRGMATSSVWRDDWGLFCAAKKYFGSWHDAMLAAGLSDISNPKPKVRWSKQQVIKELCARHKAGLSLNCTHPTNRLLYGAAKRHLGGWRKALAAAGIDPKITKPTYQKKAKGT